jgi:hypothetical protein
MIPIDQIKKLKEGATKGPWEHTNAGSVHGPKGLVCEFGMVETEEEEEQTSANFAFIAALPDIADTAIAALQRVEELREFIRQHVPDGAERRKVLPIIITNPPANN